MASFKYGLMKHPSGYYHYCFKIHGRQYKGSTRATDRATAEKVLAEKRREALLGRTTLRSGVVTVRDLVQNWLETHRGTLSPSHLRSVEQITRIWVLPTLGSCPINRVNTATLLGLRKVVLGAGRSPQTANLLFRVMKLLWNYGLKVGLLDTMPFRVQPLRVQRKPRPVVTGSRMQEFLAAAEQCSSNPQVAAMLKMMVGCGMRESEVLGARMEWIDPDARTYTVGKAKGKEARVIPIPDWVWSALSASQRSLGPWLFPAEDGKPHRPHFLRKPLARIAGELGLGHLTQHRLRATFASLHAEAGTPLSAIQAMLGHKSITTTMLYVEQTLDSKRLAQETLSKRLGLA